MTLRRPIALLLLLAALGLGACGGDGDDGNPPAAVPSTTATTPATTQQPTPARTRRLLRNPGGPKLETVAEGFEIPWEIAFLPDGRALVTERPGRVRLLAADGSLQATPVAEVDVAAEGEGGLLGLAVDPAFARNRFVYLYRTTGAGNEVARYRLDGARLREDAVVLEDVPAGPIHDGGRIHFGPDGHLYVATGETGDGSLAQDRESLAGKFLTLSPARFRGNGPARPAVFSRGHRNPQGFDWQPGTGALVATEHGPSGGDGPRGFDELNVVRSGGNYGWPEKFGDDHSGFDAPVAVYDEAIAPSGGSFVSLPGSAWTGDFLFGALVGEQVRRVSLDGGRVGTNEALFSGELGRVRSIVEGPDGALYALTSNRDGRGSPRDGDDRVVRIIPPAA
ncbi:MAG: PQQ-dependent sugar dehydrogenase [Solirubrobacteraceae bacterium]